MLAIKRTSINMYGRPFLLDDPDRPVNSAPAPVAQVQPVAAPSGNNMAEFANALKAAGKAQEQGDSPVPEDSPYLANARNYVANLIEERRRQAILRTLSPLG